MIRKEINQDGTFGGNYPQEIEYKTLPEKYILLTQEQSNFIDRNRPRLRYDETKDGIWQDPKGVIDISDTADFKAKELEKAKQKKLKENKAALENIEFFNTSLGHIRINTPVGRFDTVVMGFLNLINITKKSLPEGAFRVYDEQGAEQPSPEITPEDFANFYIEIFGKFNDCDKIYKDYEAQIQAAQSNEELDLINISYDI